MKVLVIVERGKGKGNFSCFAPETINNCGLVGYGSTFAKYIGMNASVLRQYVTAIRQPKKEQILKIREGIDKLSRDLGTNLMIDQPAVSYVK